MWSGPSKAVHVKISAVPCKSTLIPLVLIYTCYMTKGLCKMAGSQVFCFKVSDMQQGYSIKCLLWGLCMYGGLEAGCPGWEVSETMLCPAEGNGSSAFLKRVTILVVSHWLQQVVGHVFCRMSRSRQQKLSKYGGIRFWVQKLQFLLKGEIHACASKILKSSNQSSSFCP